MAGIIAATVGAKLVILTDLPEQIQHLQENVDLNRHQLNCEVICVPFSFGEKFCDLFDRFQSSHNSNLQIDCVLGADIAYDLSLLQPLTNSIYSLMSSHPNSISYLVETGSISLLFIYSFFIIIFDSFFLSFAYFFDWIVRWKDIYQWFLQSILLQDQDQSQSREQEEEEEGEGNEEERNKNEEMIVLKPLSLQQTIVLYDKEKSIGEGFVVIHPLNEDGSVSQERKINTFSRASVLLHIFQQ